MLVDRPDDPTALLYLWEYFWDIGRSSNGFGPVPMSWSDIVNWQIARRVQLSDDEIRVIRMLDGVYMEVARDAKPKKETK